MGGAVAPTQRSPRSGREHLCQGRACEAAARCPTIRRIATLRSTSQTQATGLLIAAAPVGDPISPDSRRCDGCAGPLPPNVAPGPARRWCSDRCRRATLYGGTCAICGDATNGSQGPAAAGALCRQCYQSATKAQTRWRLLLEAERWHALTSRWPLASDWNRHVHRGELRELLERYHALTGPWPHPATVGKTFGSWADFHATLGHEPCPGGRGTPKGTRIAELRELIAQSIDTPGSGDDAA